MKKINIMTLTTDNKHLDLGHGVDTEPCEQNKVYLVLSDEERAEGFIRPVRTTYTHNECKGATTMGLAIAETYARKPDFYGSTYCVHCKTHRPLREFVWEDGSVVGS